jgi:hypothetical protein
MVTYIFLTGAAVATARGDLDLDRRDLDTNGLDPLFQGRNFNGFSS